MAIKNPRAGQDKIPPADRIATHFKELVASSVELNSAKQELGNVIAAFEKPLRSITPQIATWHEIARGDAENGFFWHRDIGYAELGNDWRIVLREVSYETPDPSDRETQIWAFSDAPQWMQIESVGKLPDLLETIVERTRDTTKKIRAKTEQARKMVEALSHAAAQIDEENKGGAE